MYGAVSWKNELIYNSNIDNGQKFGLLGQLLPEKTEKFANFSWNFADFLAIDDQLPRKPLRITY